MNDLDTEIRRAMGELSGAAPLPRAPSALGDLPPRRRKVVRPLVPLVGVVMVVAVVVATVMFSRDRGRDIAPVLPSASSAVGTTPPVEPGDEIVTGLATTPPGLAVWSVSRLALSRPVASTVQLFGRFTASGDRIAAGLLVTTSIDASDEPNQASGPTVQVGDVTASVYDDGHGERWMAWTAEGVLVEASYRGFSDEEAARALAALSPRADPSDGFDPASASVDLPLVAEDRHDPARAVDLTVFLLGAADQPPTIQAVNTGPKLIVASGASIFGSTATILFAGTRQPDGTIEAPLTGGVENARHRIDPDGSVVSAVAPTAEERAALLAAAGPITVGDRAAMLRAASDRLSRLPELLAVDVGSRAVVLRGGTIDEPQAICVRTATTERCGLGYGTLTPAEGEPHAGRVEIDGAMLLFGWQTDSADPVAALDWRPGLPRTVSSPDVRVVQGEQSLPVDGRRYWIIEVPPDFADVAIGTLRDGVFDFPGSTFSGARRLGP